MPDVMGEARVYVSIRSPVNYVETAIITLIKFNECESEQIYLRSDRPADSYMFTAATASESNFLFVPDFFFAVEPV